MDKIAVPSSSIPRCTDKINLIDYAYASHFKDRCLLGYGQIKEDLTVFIYLKEEYVKRTKRISMKYGKHGFEEEDLGSIC